MATSMSGGIFESLFWLYMAIAVIVGGLVVGWLGYILVKFRARPGMARPRDAPKAGVIPAERGHPIWSYVMALVIAGIMFGLAFGTISAIHTLETPPEEGDRIDVKVIGFQFGWRINYTGVGGIPVSRVNEWTVPVETAVVADVTSQDVWHNFALPAYRIRIDAIPGETTHIWFKAHKEETTSPVCVQICGPGHALMKSTMHVVSKEKFADYLAAESETEYQKLAKAGNVLNATYDGATIDVEDKAPTAGKAFAFHLTNAAAEAQTFALGANEITIPAGATAYLYAPAGSNASDLRTVS